MFIIMPEGPSIVILKELVKEFKGQEILSVSGNSTAGIDRLKNQTVLSFKSWGKHFLICFKEFTLKIHFLLFGTYRINERKESPPRLSLLFPNGELNLYTCSVRFLEGSINDYYDWSSDVMSRDWDSKKAQLKLLQVPEKLICDALLEQEIFSGVGNIIKNEVLFRTQVHPESKVGKIPKTILATIIDESSKYSFDFLEWKKKFVLKEHWLAHTKKICSRCSSRLIKKQTGIKKRRSFFCENCQKLYQ